MRSISCKTENPQCHLFRIYRAVVNMGNFLGHSLRRLMECIWLRHQIVTLSALLAFVRGIHRSPVNSPHKVQWRGALKLSLIWAWTNGWVNNQDVGDLRRHRVHYYGTVKRDGTAGIIPTALFAHSITRRNSYINNEMIQHYIKVNCATNSSLYHIPWFQ